MEQELSNLVIAEINLYLPQLIDDYLDDNKSVLEEAIKAEKTPQVALNLAITLKHWANPLGNYVNKLPATDLINFQGLKDILRHPRLLVSADKYTKGISDHDANEIADLVRIKLDQLAESLIQKYNLNIAIETEFGINQSTIENWWNDKTDYEKLLIKNEYDNLSQQEKAALKQRMQSYSSSSISQPLNFNYYCMCHHRSQISLAEWLVLWQATDLFAHLAHSHALDAPVNCVDNLNVDGDKAHAIVILLAIAAAAAMIGAGIIGGIYAAKKAINSVWNAVTGNKICRSLFRLCGIGGGAYGGAIGGGLAGGALGSIIPGVGNVAGAIIGTVFGAGIGGGLGALITKYAAKGISYCFNSDKNNPFNPEKFELTEKQKENLRNKGHDLVTINKMLRAIRREKDKIGINGSFFWTEERDRKNELNALLIKIKNGEINEPIKIGLLYYDSKLNDASEEMEKPRSYQSSTASMLPTLHELSSGSPTPPRAPAPSAPPYELAFQTKNKRSSNDDVTKQQESLDLGDESIIRFRNGS